MYKEPQKVDPFVCGHDIMLSFVPLIVWLWVFRCNFVSGCNQKECVKSSCLSTIRAPFLAPSYRPIKCRELIELPSNLLVWVQWKNQECQHHFWFPQRYKHRYDPLDQLKEYRPYHCIHTLFRFEWGATMYLLSEVGWPPKLLGYVQCYKKDLAINTPINFKMRW